MENLIAEYNALRAQIETLEATRKAVAEQIKNEIKALDVKSVKVNGFTASIVSSFSRSCDWKTFQNEYNELYAQLVKESTFETLRVSKGR